ncbi:MAG: aminotransferase class IV [Chlamydiota bacterium]
MNVYYLNDTFLSEEEAKISVLDLGLIRGFGVFDYLRTYQRRPFHIEEHLERLKFSAKELRLTIDLSQNELAKIIEKLIAMSSHQELSIKILVTGGVSVDQFLPAEKSSVIIFAYELKVPPENFYSNGINTVTTPLARTVPTSKTLNYIPGILAIGKSKDAKEALYLNAKNELLEGTTSNIFAIKNRTLITPHSQELLLGITREIVLNLASHDFEIKEEAISFAEIENYDEFFLTSSSREILPIVKIDDHIIKNGKPGPHTKELQKRFAHYTTSSAWPRLRIGRYEDREVASKNTLTFSIPTDNRL